VEQLEQSEPIGGTSSFPRSWRASGRREADLVEAERLATVAVAGSEDLDSLTEQCLAVRDLAVVFASARRVDEVEAALEQALERAGRKKNLALARQISERLGELEAQRQPRRDGTSRAAP
jgi:hypothetical protein